MAGPKKGVTLEDRFWNQIHKTDTCWLWIGTRNNKGYGQIRDGQKKLLAHRLSWILHYGEIPAGLNILHRCDIGACVRPDHLFTGTQSENLLDASKKNRIGGSLQGNRYRKGSKNVTEIL